MTESYHKVPPLRACPPILPGSLSLVAVVSPSPFLPLYRLSFAPPKNIKAGLIKHLAMLL